MSQFDRELNHRQLKLVKKLRYVLVFFFVISMTLMIFDFLYRIKAKNTSKNCNTSLFNDEWAFLNAVVWFFTRMIANVSPIILTIYMFRKQRGNFRDT